MACFVKAWYNDIFKKCIATNAVFNKGFSTDLIQCYLAIVGACAAHEVEAGIPKSEPTVGGLIPGSAVCLSRHGTQSCSLAAAICSVTKEIHESLPTLFNWERNECGRSWHIFHMIYCVDICGVIDRQSPNTASIQRCASWPGRYIAVNPLYVYTLWPPPCVTRVQTNCSLLGFHTDT